MSKRKWLDPFREISSVQKGKAAEYLVITKLLLKGFSSFIPTTEVSKADLLIHSNHRILKAQIKIIGHSNSMPVRKVTVNSKTNTKISRYTESDIDFFIAVDLQSFELFIVPIQFAVKYSISISRKTLVDSGFLENYNILN